MNVDWQLLQEYRLNRSSEAFATLVSRYRDFVYAAAMRQVDDPLIAEEITQAVFITLARRASSLNRSTVLAGWLYRTSRYAVAITLRTEISRLRRAEENGVEIIPEQTESDQISRELIPLLDDGLAALRSVERDALLLRFFQGKTVQEIGALLGIEECAVQKRITRSVKKLQIYYFKQGATVSAATVILALSSAGKAASSRSLSPVGAILDGSAPHASLTLAEQTMEKIAWLKLKVLAVGMAAALIAATLAVMALSGGDKGAQHAVSLR